MKKYNMPDKLDELRTVPEGYAAAHMPEMLQAVSRDNMAFFIANGKNMAVMVPYWWYAANFGNDVRKTVENLFEDSRDLSSDHAMVSLAIVDGYLSRVSRIIGKEIAEMLMERMADHPHAAKWTALLELWEERWRKDTAPELWVVMAKFAGNRQIYLLYQNGATRLLDGRKLIGRGLSEADLADESVFYSRITMTSGALLWMSEENQIMWAVSSDEMLELSTPVDPSKALSIWETIRVAR